MSKRTGIKRLTGYSLEASYTVEAALVMSVTLFLIASLLLEAFRIHSRVASDMVLQDALEQAGHMEEGTELEDILSYMNRWLKAGFRCEDKSVSIEETGERFEGAVSGDQGAYSHEISVKKFDPEHFLRLIRAIGV